MSVNLSALAAIKAAHAKRIVPAQDDMDAELCELGIDTPTANCWRQEKRTPVLMAKTDSQNIPKDTVRNCGNCFRWNTCTKLHRAGRISPNLCACDGHRFSD